MAVVRYYVVTQEREVIVEATSPGEAVALSEAVFGGPRVEAVGHPFGGPVKVTSVSAREDY